MKSFKSFSSDLCDCICPENWPGEPPFEAKGASFVVTIGVYAETRLEQDIVECIENLIARVESAIRIERKSWVILLVQIK